MHSFSTTFNTGFLDDRFAKRATSIAVPSSLDKLPRGKFNFFDEARLFMRVIGAAWKEDCLLLFSSRGYYKPELLAISFIGLWPQKLRPTVILYGEMFQPNYGFRNLIEKLILKIANRAVRYFVVVSMADRETFSQTWGIDKNKIRFCPFYSFPPEEDVQMNEAPAEEHIFAGGNSFRDYAPFIEAIEKISDTKFYLCATKLPPRESFPPNVQVGPVPFDEYKRLIKSAKAVVIPLEMGLQRSAGMLTYFDAMWSKIPVIISDALGVREYISDGETGIVVDGSTESYVDAIRWVTSPKNQEKLQGIVEQAYHTVKTQFTLQNHISCLLNIIDDAMA